MNGGAMQYLLHNKQIAFRHTAMNGGAMQYLLHNKQIAFRYTAMNRGAMIGSSTINKLLFVTPP
jgi:hypothetical protein